MLRTLRTTHTLLATLAVALVFILPAAAQDPEPPVPTPEPPHCTILGVPSCAEANSVVKTTITVRDENGRARIGAEVRLGTTISGTTNSDGKHDAAATCGGAGSNIEVNVYVGGKLCGTKTIHCYEKDKDGNWIVTAAQLASVGSKTLTTKNLLSSQNQLTFDGTTFTGPEVTDLVLNIDMSKTASGNLYGEITGFRALYDDFEAAGYRFGQTKVVLKDNDANYLSINQDSGEVNGYLQTLIYNDVVQGLERHLHLTGSFDGEILELNVAGFLIESGPSDAIHDADEAHSTREH